MVADICNRFTSSSGRWGCKCAVGAGNDYNSETQLLRPARAYSLTQAKTLGTLRWNRIMVDRLDALLPVAMDF